MSFDYEQAIDNLQNFLNNRDRLSKITKRTFHDQDKTNRGRIDQNEVLNALSITFCICICDFRMTEEFKGNKLKEKLDNHSVIYNYDIYEYEQLVLLAFESVINGFRRLI